MKTKFVLVMLAMLIAAIPATAGGEKCPAANAQICLDGWAAKKGSVWTGIDLDKSAAGVVTVKNVVASSPAVVAGFEVGDEVVTLNGASITDMEAVKKAKGEWKAGQVVTYTIKRKGADKTLTVTLATIPDDVFVAMLGRHMLENHVTMTAAATETKAPEAKAASTDKK
jgi:predicted metalloprotease with PDZ domain